MPPCWCTKQKKICSHSLRKNLIVPVHQHGCHDDHMQTINMTYKYHQIVPDRGGKTEKKLNGAPKVFGAMKPNQPLEIYMSCNVRLFVFRGESRTRAFYDACMKYFAPLLLKCFQYSCDDRNLFSSYKLAFKLLSISYHRWFNIFYNSKYVSNI